MLDASCKVALAAYLHDLGKFAERAKIEVQQEKLDAHIQLYCPRKTTPQGHQFPTHKHAAYTALAWDILEKHIPDLIVGNMYPFASRSENNENLTDSLLNASAMHHRPETFLQWVIATADRVASGFERDEFEKYNLADDEIHHKKRKTGNNHYQARLLTLFEQIGLSETTDGFTKSNEDLRFCYPLKELTADAIFPLDRNAYEPAENAAAQAEYHALWDSFLSGLVKIPVAHRKNWALWLDHFDTSWQVFTQAIPSATAFGVKPEVSLYDHSKTTAALAVALWRWHEENRQTSQQAADALKNRSDWEEQKFLLIQGDFFGIQDFIFASGSQTNKKAAKLLRGRSFQVSLFSELAALKVLQACDLPPTSQILNAAGKFMIVAPNTPAIRSAFENAKNEMNQWFIDHSYGQVGLGLVMQPVCCNEFTDKARFKQLISSLFSTLEVAKLQRFGLLTNCPTVLPVDYSNGVCIYNEKLPAISGKTSSFLSEDQIKIGGLLTRQNRLMVLQDASDVHLGGQTNVLKQSVFGFHIAFTDDESVTGRFGDLARKKHLLRCWDFSLPESVQDSIWQGYGRRYINAYVPRFVEVDEFTGDKYQSVNKLEDDVDFNLGEVKTLNHIACEDQRLKEDGAWIGVEALTTLKGDVDNLGKIFEKGLAQPTFAKMSALSRQMNNFFSLWLPAYCASHTKYRNMYTVFAGGDDFFLIGPWLTTQELAFDMRQKFTAYVAQNPELHFSVGMALSKPGLPLPKLSSQAELALDQAKSFKVQRGNIKNEAHFPDKNAVSVYGECVSWHSWPQILTAQQEIERLRQEYELSTSYMYGMLSLIDLKADKLNLESAMWRSRFVYRTYRYVNEHIRHKDKEQTESLRAKVVKELAYAFGENGIEKLGTSFRIPLFNHLYSLRLR